MKISRFLALLLIASVLHAEEPESVAKGDASKKPTIEKIDATRYRIGRVILDQKTREIRVPAILNMKEGLLEFLIVHEHGAVHEALLRTTASPTNINLAFKLLRYKPSKELYRIPKEPGIPSDKFYEVDPETKQAARISINLEYEVDGKTKRIAAREWIRNETTLRAMPPTPWIYGGSNFYDGRFIPESTGQIAAIFVTDTSLLNYSGEDKFNDEVWTVYSDRTPDLETKVTLVFAPYKES